MEYSAKEIAKLLNGIVEGDPTIKVHNVSKIEDGSQGTLAFLANPKYTKFIYNTKASIVLVSRNFIADEPVEATLIRVDDPYTAFATLLEQIQPQLDKNGVDKYVYIHPTAKIGDNAYIGAFTYIGENVVIGTNVKIYPQVYVGDNVHIGNDTILGPGVKIYYDCKIGANCILHAGSVVGSDGFGFAPQGDNVYQKIPQLGNVLIEDSVEIGANTTIDRATIGSTIIRAGVKLDNLIQVAHNVEIGENTVIAAQTGISGSAKIGKDCQIGGQVGIVGHIVIADEVKIGAQSGVPSAITEKGITVLGTPTLPIRDFQRSAIVFKHLPEMSRKIAELERRIEKMTEQLNK